MSIGRKIDDMSEADTKAALKCALWEKIYVCLDCPAVRRCKKTEDVNCDEVYLDYAVKEGKRRWKTD